MANVVHFPGGEPVEIYRCAGCGQWDLAPGPDTLPAGWSYSPLVCGTCLLLSWSDAERRIDLALGLEVGTTDWEPEDG